jgi:hypothetical protein
MKKTRSVSYLASYLVAASVVPLILIGCETNPRKVETPPAAPVAPPTPSVAVKAPEPPPPVAPRAPAPPPAPVVRYAEPLNGPVVTVNGSVGAMARGEGYSLSLFQLDYDPRRRVVYYDVKMSGPAGKAKRIQISEARAGSPAIQLFMDDAPNFRTGQYSTLTPNTKVQTPEFSWLGDNGSTRTTFHIEIDEGNRVIKLVQPVQFSNEVKKIIFQSAN